MLQSLSTLTDLLLVIFGFGAIIFIHELGHFLAAKWAGIRVHEFAIGFGPAIGSYRRGVGLRSGSTWPEVQKRVGGADPLKLPAGVGATEYRLNWLPLGGYVKMLGQEDLNPSATSSAPDSYAAKPPWKRLVVISAGVVMNLILAALLFIVVFLAGLGVSPPLIGGVAPDSPAAKTEPLNAGGAGVERTGLAPGDRILEIGGREANSFKDVFAAAGLAEAGEPLRILVERAGVDEPLVFDVVPEKSERTRLLELGVYAASSTTIALPADPASARVFDRMLSQAGMSEIEPGWTITSVAGEPAEYFFALEDAFANSGGESVRLTARSASGLEKTVDVAPGVELQSVFVSLGEQPFPIEHLLGLCPPMLIESVTDRARESGLRSGDIVARLGRLEWPQPGEAIRAIRARAGRTIQISVLRDGEFVDIEARVGADERIGFDPGQARDSTIIATLDSQAVRPTAQTPEGDAEERSPFAAQALDLMPGSAILTVGGRDVTDYAEIRLALRAATESAAAAGEGADIPMRIRLPLGEGFGTGPIEEATWSLSAADVASLHELGWTAPLPEYLFEPAETIIQTSNPIRAIQIGLQETQRVVVMTYVTLLRLFEGSVKVEHLKGPVGIAHIGTRVAGQGLDQLIFFLAIISVNLAVLNFLPLPIVDGGHAVFILIEWITGKPVSVAVQNVATILGLALLGAVFLVVTYNDLVGLFSG